LPKFGNGRLLSFPYLAPRSTSDTQDRMSYTLHYAPDNASLIVRLALEHRGLPYRAALVDRAAQAQKMPAYRRLNPHGLIPALETPEGAFFETGAILLWLADRHGGLGPGPDDPARGDFLKWLFFAANTLHPAERMLFYPEKYIDPAQTAALSWGIATHLLACFDRMEAAAADRPDWLGGDSATVLDFYLCGLLRWPALYPRDTDCGWFDTTRWPALRRVAERVEALPATAALCAAEGLGPAPFTDPQYPSPPEGSAT
jgi:glutathione S-transferase